MEIGSMKNQNRTSWRIMRTTQGQALYLFELDAFLAIRQTTAIYGLVLVTICPGWLIC